MWCDHRNYGKYDDLKECRGKITHDGICGLASGFRNQPERDPMGGTEILGSTAPRLHLNPLKANVPQLCALANCSIARPPNHRTTEAPSWRATGPPQNASTNICISPGTAAYTIYLQFSIKSRGQNWRKCGYENETEIDYFAALRLARLTRWATVRLSVVRSNRI